MEHFDYDLNNVEKQIIQLLQTLNVPISICYLLMFKITEDLKRAYNQQILLDEYEINKQQTQSTNSFGQNVMMGSEPPEGYVDELVEAKETE